MGIIWMLVLDTNVVSEFMRPAMVSSVDRWLKTADRSEMFLTAITVAEVLYGIARMPDGRRKREAAAVIHEILTELADRVIAFDVDSAVHYADIVSQREFMGRPISAADGQIAAICRQHGATLATRNTKDFLHTGVTLIDPWTAGDTP